MSHVISIFRCTLHSGLVSGRVNANVDSIFGRRKLFSDKEIKKLRENLEEPDSALMAQSYEQDDGDGRNVRMILWNNPGEDLTGRMNRCEKVVNTCEAVTFVRFRQSVKQSFMAYVFFIRL